MDHLDPQRAPSPMESTANAPVSPQVAEYGVAPTI
jgi:hypothetical protein